METTEVPEPLSRLLRSYCNVNAMDAIPYLREDLSVPQNAEKAALFREQLAEAILKNTLTPSQYERLTGQDFDSQEDLNAWLRELWNELFPGERVPEGKSED